MNLEKITVFILTKFISLFNGQDFDKIEEFKQQMRIAVENFKAEDKASLKKIELENAKSQEELDNRDLGETKNAVEEMMVGLRTLHKDTYLQNKLLEVMKFIGEGRDAPPPEMNDEEEIDVSVITSENTRIAEEEVESETEEEKDDRTTPHHEIDIKTEELIVNNAIVFHITNTESEDTVEWNFGDDESDDNTSDEQTPTHAYHQAGRYTVKATVNGNTHYEKDIVVTESSESSDDQHKENLDESKSDNTASFENIPDQEVDKLFDSDDSSDDDSEQDQKLHIKADPSYGRVPLDVNLSVHPKDSIKPGTYWESTGEFETINTNPVILKYGIAGTPEVTAKIKTTKDEEKMITKQIHVLPRDIISAEGKEIKTEEGEENPYIEVEKGEEITFTDKFLYEDDKFKNNWAVTRQQIGNIDWETENEQKFSHQFKVSGVTEYVRLNIGPVGIVTLRVKVLDDEYAIKVEPPTGKIGDKIKISIDPTNKDDEVEWTLNLSTWDEPLIGTRNPIHHTFKKAGTYKISALINKKITKTTTITITDGLNLLDGKDVHHELREYNFIDADKEINQEASGRKVIHIQKGDTITFKNKSTVEKVINTQWDIKNGLDTVDSIEKPIKYNPDIAGEYPAKLTVHTKDKEYTDEVIVIVSDAEKASDKNIKANRSDINDTTILIPKIASDPQKRKVANLSYAITIKKNEYVQFTDVSKGGAHHRRWELYKLVNRSLEQIDLKEHDQESINIGFGTATTFYMHLYVWRDTPNTPVSTSITIIVEANDQELLDTNVLQKDSSTLKNLLKETATDTKEFEGLLLRLVKIYNKKRKEWKKIHPISLDILSEVRKGTAGTTPATAIRWINLVRRTQHLPGGAHTIYDIVSYIKRDATTTLKGFAEKGSLPTDLYRHIVDHIWPKWDRIKVLVDKYTIPTDDKEKEEAERKRDIAILEYEEILSLGVVLPEYMKKLENHMNTYITYLEKEATITQRITIEMTTIYNDLKEGNFAPVYQHFSTMIRAHPKASQFIHELHEVNETTLKLKDKLLPDLQNIYTVMNSFSSSVIKEIKWFEANKKSLTLFDRYLSSDHIQQKETILTTTHEILTGLRSWQGHFQEQYKTLLATRITASTIHKEMGDLLSTEKSGTIILDDARDMKNREPLTKNPRAFTDTADVTYKAEKNTQEQLLFNNVLSDIKNAFGQFHLFRHDFSNEIDIDDQASSITTSLKELATPSNLTEARLKLKRIVQQIQTLMDDAWDSSKEDEPFSLRALRTACNRINKFTDGKSPAVSEADRTVTSIKK